MILKLLVNAVAVFLAAYLLRGVEIKKFWWALIFGVVLSIINAILAWIIL